MRPITISSITPWADPMSLPVSSGLDAAGNVAFDYRYDEFDFCGTAWNAIESIGRTCS